VNVRVDQARQQEQFAEVSDSGIHGNVVPTPYGRYMSVLDEQSRRTQSLGGQHAIRSENL
jgi:hypothetical protein